MAITVERRPYVVVTDQESGWSLTGGMRTGDGYQTKEMSHPNGARCTVQIVTEDSPPDELVLAITGVLYLNPGEQTPRAVIRKIPDVGDFITRDALYEVARVLLRAWYEATFKTLRPLTIKIPN